MRNGNDSLHLADRQPGISFGYGIQQYPSHLLPPCLGFFLWHAGKVRNFPPPDHRTQINTVSQLPSESRLDIYIYILKLAQIMELEAGCPVNSRKCWIWSNNKSLKCECLCRWFRGPTLKLQEHYIPCKKAYITLLYIYLQRPKHVSKLKHLVNWRYLVKTHRKQFDQTTILCTFRGEPLEFKFVGLNIK